MNKKTFLIISIIILSLIPLVPGYTEETKWILEERGDCYEIYYNSANPNQKRWNSAPLWIYNGTEYVPYIFKNMGDYFSIQTGIIGAEIYKSKAVFYDPQLENIAVGRETWLVYKKKVDGSWNPVAASLGSYFKSVNVVEGDEQVSITGTWETPKGELSIEYLFKENLKHTVTWTPNEAGTYVIVQFWNNTLYSDVTLENGTKIIRTQGDAIIGKTDSLTFLFGNDTQPFGVLENQHSASDLLHKTLFAKGTIYYEGIQITDGVAWIFYNSTLCTVNSGETIEIDPLTATLSNPWEDGHISRNPSAIYSLRNDLDYLKVGDIGSGSWDGWEWRAYSIWSIASIPDNAEVSLMKFKYECSVFSDVHRAYIREIMEADPDWTGTDGQKYSDCGAGDSYGILEPSGTGQNKEFTLIGNAETDLEVALAAEDTIWGIGLTDVDNNHATPFELRSEEYPGVPPPTLYVEYTLPAPTVSSAQITNMDNTDDLFPMYRWYEFAVIMEYNEGGADEITKVYLRGKDGTNTIFEVRGDSLNSTPAWTIQTGSDIIDLDTSSCSWETSGTQGNATFIIRIEYDHPQYLNMELDVYSENIDEDTYGWVNAQTDYYDTVSNIVTTFNLDDDRGNLSQSVTASGQITFEGSSLYPDDSNFTGVSVYDSNNNNEGTDNTIVNGEWEITFNTPGTVGLDTYNLYIDIIDDYTDGEETSPTDTFVNDRYNVTSFWASDYNPSTGENITLYAIFESEYDSHICDGDDSITLEDLTFTYDPIEEYFFTEIGKDENGTYYFDNLNYIYENTYEVYDGNLDYNLSVTWGNFKYDFYGPFYENGTASGNTTIYVHLTDTTESFTLEGEANKTYAVMPLMVRWDLEGGASRVIYPISDNETYYIFEPFTDYGGYVFTIKDYSNVIGSQNSFLEALETINGTKRLIVRQLIWDTVNPITLILQKDATYEIQIRTLTGYIYNYGYFTPAVDTTRILIINEVEWGKKIHYVGADLIIEAHRPSDNHIQVNYKDETEGTESIFIEICLRNNTQVWNATSTEQMIQFNWHNAVNTTGYIVKMTIEHELYGTCEYTTFIPECKPDVPTFPDFDILGEGLTTAFGILLIIVPLLVFSRAHRVFGMFCTNIMAYIVTYLEILTIPYEITHVVMAFTIIWGLWESDRQ